jgi:hypothetical protein
MGRIRFGQGCRDDACFGSRRTSDEEHDGLRRLCRSQQIESAPELIWPCAGSGVIKRNDEITLGRSPQASLDRFPRFQIVRQRDRAEVCAERRADFCCSRKHRRYPRLDANIEVSPGGIAGFDRFENRSRHREDTGIAARDNGDALTFGGERERVACPVDLDAIAGRMTATAEESIWNPIEIGFVSNEIRCRLQRPPRRRRQEIDRSRSKADDDERAAHNRLP